MRAGLLGILWGRGGRRRPSTGFDFLVDAVGNELVDIEQNNLEVKV